MGVVLAWLSANWFSLLQTIGIVGGLFVTAYTLAKTSRERKVDTLINLTQQHRSIWLKFLESPSLKRINKPDIDLTKHPVTDEEFIFVNLIILHIATVLVAVKQGITPQLAGQDVDIRDFFVLPIPSVVWNQTKSIRDYGTIGYVEALLKAEKL